MKPTGDAALAQPTQLDVGDRMPAADDTGERARLAERHGVEGSWGARSLLTRRGVAPLDSSPANGCALCRHGVPSQCAASACRLGVPSLAVATRLRPPAALRGVNTRCSAAPDRPTLRTHRVGAPCAAEDWFSWPCRPITGDRMSFLRAHSLVPDKYRQAVVAAHGEAKSVGANGVM